ncbi:hypothetical protein [Sphingomonas sp. PR090111-T3T-6A]|uniref:hypothetical protein n=1 Tax=Sphingomonas sp. PR090111-T3T-6A TaxID=685778 RepID=UPI00036CCB91|nr:hypothetical protein [Sphingomonas sp. PR090111-T3T-6A]
MRRSLEIRASAEGDAPFPKGHTMRNAIQEKRTDDRALEAGIEWIVARQLAPLQDELMKLRTYVEALRQVVEPR